MDKDGGSKEDGQHGLRRKRFTWPRHATVQLVRLVNAEPIFKVSKKEPSEAMNIDKYWAHIASELERSVDVVGLEGDGHRVKAKFYTLHRAYRIWSQSSTREAQPPPVAIQCCVGELAEYDRMDVEHRKSIGKASRRELKVKTVDLTSAAKRAIDNTETSASKRTRSTAGSLGAPFGSSSYSAHPAGPPSLPAPAMSAPSHSVTIAPSSAVLPDPTVISQHFASMSPADQAAFMELRRKELEFEGRRMALQEEQTRVEAERIRMEAERTAKLHSVMQALVGTLKDLSAPMPAPSS